MAATRFLALASRRLTLHGAKFLTKQGVLLLLFGLAIFASFRYETFGSDFPAAHHAKGLK